MGSVSNRAIALRVASAFAAQLQVEVRHERHGGNPERTDRAIVQLAVALNKVARASGKEEDHGTENSLR